MKTGNWVEINKNIKIEATESNPNTVRINAVRQRLIALAPNCCYVEAKDVAGVSAYRDIMSGLWTAKAPVLAVK